MASSVPATVELAFQQLGHGLARVGLGELKLLEAPWPEVERGVARLLGGPFDPRRPDHQAVAFGVAAVFGKRLAAEHGAFYAHNRESPDGVVLGFPEAILMLSPFGAAVEALSRANLSQLDETAREIRTVLGRARLSVSAGPPARLTARDYERLFDPAFVQLVLLDNARLKEAWEVPAGTLTRNLRDALDRAAGLPPDVRKALESQLVGALSALDPKQTMIQQVGKAGRLLELTAHLVASVETTQPAAEEFWAAVVFPLLFIGAPATFPPLGEDDRAEAREGMDPLFLFLDLVPYQVQVADDGVLGVFEPETIGPPHPDLAGLAPLRLLSLKFDVLDKPLATFDPGRSRETFKRFCSFLEEQIGKRIDAAGSDPVLDEAFALIADLKRVGAARGKGAAALRRITEAEATSEPPLGLVRKALQGPRIILV